MKVFVTHRYISASILMMIALLGVENVSYSQAVCQVGDIIQPGESCTYPGTNDVFSVDDAGRARFLFFTAGGNLIIRDSNINGRRYTLVTEHSAGGGRRIAELAGATAPPPADDDTPIEPEGDDPILMPDPNLAAAIQEEIGNSITRQTLLNLTRLYAPNSGITDLTGLEHAHNLRELNLGFEHISGEGAVNSNTISDFSPIAGLTQLTSLNLTHCGLSDVSFLSGLTQLTNLSLRDNNISDISPLAELTQLTDLSLWDNNISDISPLAGLKKLTTLWLHENSISDVTPLVNLVNLRELRIHYNPIKNQRPLLDLLRKNPGIKIYLKDRNTPLPVSLSHFRAEHTDAGVVLKWTTESEIDNAGFYIYRSDTKDGEFKVVNPTMVQGAGTTSERNEYTWTDTTAKPNTVYFYQIEDISHAGVRKRLATVRLKGLVSASGKLLTKWADLKYHRK